MTNKRAPARARGGAPENIALYGQSPAALKETE
jgi:hypothetical protein